MAFNSLEYLLFFLIVSILYYSIPFRFRWIMLLIASYLFYMAWKPPYVLIIITQTIVAYGTALMIGKLSDRHSRIIWVSIGLTINIGMLLVYKYLKFFTTTFNSIFEYFHFSTFLPVYDLLLPIGISFFTFQTSAYIVDVYRGTLQPEKHFGLFSLFIGLFPHLMAGPITRGSHILPQLKKEVPFSRNRVTGGLKLILLGLFKKMVIADRLGVLVDTVFNNPHNYSGAPLIVASVFFAFQIYCDFSGYVDIAIGSAQVLGVDFPDNFDHPYLSTSIGEFWRRWHMTLMAWLRDYVYFPLGGSHHGLARTCLNTLITFLISGLWHGASWTFVVWGALNGFYMIIERVTKSIRQKVVHSLGLDSATVLSQFYNVSCIVMTFTLTCFAFIFFRANSLADAGYITTHLFPGFGGYGGLSNLGLDMVDFYFGISAVVLLETFEWFHKRENMRFMLSNKPKWLRWGFVYALALMVLFFRYQNERPFVYFAY